MSKVEVNIKTIGEVDRAISEKLCISTSSVNLKKIPILNYGYKNIIFITIKNLTPSKITENGFLKKNLVKNVIVDNCDIEKNQQKIIRKVNDKQEVLKAYSFLPTGLGHYENQDELLSQILRQTTIEEEKYIYANIELEEETELSELEEKFTFLTNNLKDTLLMILGIAEEEVPFIIWEQKELKKTWQIRPPEEKEYSKYVHLEKEFSKLYQSHRKDIFNSSISYGKSEFRELCNPHQLKTILVYEEDNEIQGFIEAEVVKTDNIRTMVDKRIMKINKLYVKEPKRRQKIGTRLYQEIWQKSFKQKCDRLEVEIYNFTPEAKKFFESFGLKTVSAQYEIKVSKTNNVNQEIF